MSWRRSAVSLPQPVQNSRMSEPSFAPATISVVVPARNEEATIADVVARSFAAFDELGRTGEVLVVNDGSADNTAAVLAAKLPHLPAWTTARRRLAARYDILLADLPVERPVVAVAAEPVWHLYVLRCGQRDALLEHLNRAGIGAGVHYPVPLHLQPAYADLGYQLGDLPVSEAVAATCLSLPIYPEMTDAQQDHVVAEIRRFFAAAGTE